jgi:cell division protein ZapD
VILYEYPFNERVRTYLRLLQLFDRLGVLIARQDALDHHFALGTLFEILEVASRSELKGEVLKDLERQKQQYLAYRGNPAIAEAVLEQVVAELDRQFGALNEIHGKIGQPLQEQEFLVSLRSRFVIPGGSCEFDLPAYHAWKHLPADRRREDLQAWVACLAPLAQSVRTLLQLMRETGSRQKVMATGGQLQQNLPQGRSFQLLRLRIDSALGLVPEISCNRLLVVIRLLQTQRDGRLVAATDDVGFELTLCG